jgi:predicted phage gp36 major capsid-like protein
MIRSNALNGATVGYRAVQQTGTNHLGSLRVVGQSCNAGVVATDRCFNSQASKTTLASSTEQFGMTGRFINRTSSTVPTANLSLVADYDSTATTGYAWTESGAFTSVATSTDVIDDEAVVLGFGAVAALTTPPGQYQAQADFIAIPMY